MIQQTSLAAYDEICKELGPRQSEVLRVLADHPEGLCGWQVAELIGRHPYVVRPRLTDLLNHEPPLVIESDRTRVNPGGRAENIWYLALKKDGQICFDLDLSDYQKG